MLVNGEWKYLLINWLYMTGATSPRCVLFLIVARSTRNWSYHAKQHGILVQSLRVNDNHKLAQGACCFWFMSVISIVLFTSQPQTPTNNDKCMYYHVQPEISCVNSPTQQQHSMLLPQIPGEKYQCCAGHTRWRRSLVLKSSLDCSVNKYLRLFPLEGVFRVVSVRC